MPEYPYRAPLAGQGGQCGAGTGAARSTGFEKHPAAQTARFPAFETCRYPEAQDYLQGVEIVGQSYRELLPQHIGNPRTLLVLDPPYVCTQQGNYRKAAYFGMVEFLRLMAMVRPPFVFFSSTRSELPAYLDLVAELRLPGWERFAGSQTLTVSSTINRNSSYDDHLIYKF